VTDDSCGDILELSQDSNSSKMSVIKDVGRVFRVSADLDVLIDSCHEVENPLVFGSDAVCFLLLDGVRVILFNVENLEAVIVFEFLDFVEVVVLCRMNS
jgi:hypothetical protein